MNDENELSHDARALLAEARGGDDPSGEDRARVRRTLMATIAGGAGLAASTAASSAAASAGTVATTATLSLGAKIAAVVLVVGAVGGGTVAIAPWEEPAPVVSHQERRVEPSRELASRDLPIDPDTVIEPAPVVQVAPPVEEVAPEPQIEITPRRRVQVEPVAPVEPASASTLAEEVALLRSAQAALNSGDPTTALARLADHARRFPSGTMAEERDAARILALCRAGRRDEARAAATRFLRARPNSPLAARVRASCD